MKKRFQLIALLIVGFFFPGVAQNFFFQIRDDLPEILFKRFEEGHPDAKVLGPGLFLHSSPVMEQYSAVKKQFAGTLEENLYFRTESDSIILQIHPEQGQYWHMDNAMWSPDGKFLAAKQVDDRDVPEIMLVKSGGNDTIRRKYSRAGEPIPIHTFYLVDTETGKNLPIEIQPRLPYVHLLQWGKNSEVLYFIVTDRFLKEVYLLRVNAETGRSQILLKEEADTYAIGLDLLQGNSRNLILSNQAVFFEDQGFFTWMSERNGFNQIYLYDLEGNFIRPMTSQTKNGLVTSLEAVDKKNGFIYFLASPDSQKPYEKQLFKASIGGDEIQKISDAPGIMEAFLSEGHDSLWVMRSALPKTAQIDQFNAAGDFIDIYWQADFSKLSGIDINFEYLWTIASDDSTRIQSMILKPVDFDPRESYPVVEYIYGPPFNNVVPRDLFNPVLWDLNRLANAGFIVVLTDSRGTEGRGKAFKDFSYQRMGQAELDDHVSAIKQMAKTRPYMDISRVGIIGHSWGGFYALKALVKYPEFYKAGHLNAPGWHHENLRVSIEPFMGGFPRDLPSLYHQALNPEQLKNLEAPLMIVHGTFDDDVPIEESYRLVAWLENLDHMDYEFKVYDGVHHIVMSHPDWLPQMIGFFQEHLK